MDYYVVDLNQLLCNFVLVVYYICFPKKSFVLCLFVFSSIALYYVDLFDQCVEEIHFMSLYVYYCGFLNIILFDIKMQLNQLRFLWLKVPTDSDST